MKHETISFFISEHKHNFEQTAASTTFKIISSAAKMPAVSSCGLFP